MDAEKTSGAMENADMKEQPGSATDPEENLPPKKSRFNWFFAPIAFLTILLIAVTIGGFVRFAEDVSSLKAADDLEQADAIVVLTGGKQRITQAVDLFEQGIGGKLFISGVNPDISDQELQRASGASDATFNCCVILGRQAKNTIGNGKEIAEWAAKNKYKQLVVVTSNYHMTRSLYELRAMSTDVQFLPYPIMTTDLTETNWIESPDVIKALINEFAKLNYAYFRDLLKKQLA